MNVLSVAGLLGLPYRPYYSASKFALDGFGKSLQGELGHRKISVLHCYPGYVNTNCSRNALVADGSTYGMQEDYIKEGMSSDECARQIIKAMYLRRSSITLGSWYLYFAPKILFVSESLNTWYLTLSYHKKKQDVIE